jgi:hypothetical protein
LSSDTVPGLRVLHYVDRRLVNYARYAEESGAQALLVSCSSIGEAATAAQDFVSIPVLRIDTPIAIGRFDAAQISGQCRVEVHPNTALVTG